jgi:hypothetical protein
MEAGQINNRYKAKDGGTELTNKFCPAVLSARIKQRTEARANTPYVIHIF